ncbi:hypothetical protein [Azotobacter beijerinckii]|uniref:hypothetical protein n=1 Tax=Azotobacter beijerinckii TaxID=170623 RepID=UPI000B8763C5|nr:hypothetical protein [Azotobacter beijerinckii]
MQGVFRSQTSHIREGGSRLISKQPDHIGRVIQRISIFLAIVGEQRATLEVDVDLLWIVFIVSTGGYGVNAQVIPVSAKLDAGERLALVGSNLLDYFVEGHASAPSTRHMIRVELKRAAYLLLQGVPVS